MIKIEIFVTNKITTFFISINYLKYQNNYIIDRIYYLFTKFKSEKLLMIETG